MSWRPSVDEIVEVVHCGRSHQAKICKIDMYGTKQERFIVVRDWGMPQFIMTCRLNEIRRVYNREIES